MQIPSELVESIISIVKEHGKVDGGIPINKDLYSEIGVKSVNSITILLALEDKFGISIDDTQFVHARSIEKLAQLVSTATV